VVKGTPPDTFQDEWQCVVCGNFCAAGEQRRVIDYSNDRSFRGPDTGDRVIPGDAVRLRKSARGYPLAPVVEAVAGDAPIHVDGTPAVDWRPDELLPSNVYTVPRLYSLTPQPTDGGTLFWDPDDALLNDCGVNYSMASPPDSGPLTRKIFTVSGVPDPAQYPDNAQFGGAEYWCDPASLEVRVASGVAAIADTLYLVFWERGCARLTYPGGFAVAIEGEGTGYGTTADSVAISAEGVGGDFDHAYTIEAGQGAIEWRQTAAGGAASVVLRWDGLGNLVAAQARGAADDTASALTLSGASYLFPFEVRAVKSGGAFQLYSRQSSGDSWALAAEAEIAVTADTDGMVGVSAWGGGGVRFSAAGASIRNLVDFAGGGRQSGQRAVSSALASPAYMVVPMLAGRTLDEVVNETTGEAMAASTTQTRGHYRVVGSDLWLYLESNGDNVRITYTAPTEHPPLPGRPPIQRNQVNGATIPEGGDGYTSTLDVDENRLNWQDRVRIEWQGPGAFPGVPGDTLEGVRRQVFLGTPTVAVSLDRGETYTEPDQSNFRVFAADGLVLIAVSYLDTLPATDTLHLRATGEVARGGGPQDPALFNERREALLMLEDAWMQAGTCSPGAIGCSGIVDAMSLGPTGLTCRSPGGGAGTEPYPGGYVIGNKPMQQPQPGTDYPMPIPLWIQNGAGFFFFDTMQRAPFVPGSVACDISGYNLGDNFVEGEAVLEVSPEAVMSDRHRITTAGWAIPPGGSWFGGYAPYTDPLSIGAAASFGFTAPKFQAAEGMQRLAGLGAVCLEALAEVTFAGLRIWEWSLTDTFDAAAGDYDQAFYVNGVTVYHRSRTGGVEDGETNPMPDGATSGSVTFSLVARRRNTGNGLAWNGITDTMFPVPIPDHRYRSFGSGVASPVEDGVQSIVDVTGAINGLMQAMREGYHDPALWPSMGGVDPGTDEGTLAGYARALLPSVSLSTHDDHPAGWSYSASASGRFCAFGSLEVRNVMGRFRMPSGEEFVLPLPAKLPPFVRGS
jgi:hypothetical protein